MTPSVEEPAWLRYVAPPTAPTGSRRTESLFRLAQLVRKRTVISIDEAADITRRKHDTLRGSVRDLVRAGIFEWMDDGRSHCRLAPSAAWAIGVVFEHDRVVALSFDLGFRYADELDAAIIDVPSHDEPEEAFEAAAEVIETLWRRSPHTGLCLGVGLAVPAPVDVDGICRSRLSGAWHESAPAARVAEHLQRRLPGAPLPVAADNDASLGALGIFLRRYAVLDDPQAVPRDLAYVRVTDRVGVGLVLKGKFVRGGHGLAGEIAHQRAPGDGATCPRCRRSCLEVRCSTTAIERRVNAGVGAPPPGASLGRNGERLHMGSRLSALIDGRSRLTGREQSQLLEAVYDAGRLLGLIVADIAMLVDPSLIVFGGPLARDARVAARLEEGVMRTLIDHGLPLHGEERHLLPQIRSVRPADIPVAELRGAAALVLQRHADAWLWWAIEALEAGGGRAAGPSALNPVGATEHRRSITLKSVSGLCSNG